MVVKVYEIKSEYLEARRAMPFDIAQTHFYKLDRVRHLLTTENVLVPTSSYDIRCCRVDNRKEDARR